MAEYTAYVAEFVGTFLLVLTVGCNVITGSGAWAGTSIAAVLMVAIYALGPISGGNFNPAVSLSLGLFRALGGQGKEGRGGMIWSDVGIYCGVQCLAGIAAGGTYRILLKSVVNVAPAAGFGLGEAMLAEMLYTFVLCFVVLNCACSKKNDGNEYFGLAIGFVIVAGAYGAGAISGGAFNPAVALGLDLSSVDTHGFGYAVPYACFEVLGACLAVALYRIVRPDDFIPKGDVSDLNYEYSITTKCLSEFIGTFVLVLTVGLNVLAKSPAGAWSIAASLMCMIYALGSCSGAHFNPAVTVSILLSGRNKCTATDAAYYIVSQLLGGVCGAFTYTAMHRGHTFALWPQVGFNWAQALYAEFMFTFVLCFVVLCVATVPKPRAAFVGLAIGSCVTAGGVAIGRVSGGSLNPAVSMGIAASDVLNGGKLYEALIYGGFELLGAAAASAAFRMAYPSQYIKGDASATPKADEKAAPIAA